MAYFQSQSGMSSLHAIRVESNTLGWIIERVVSITGTRGLYLKESFSHTLSRSSCKLN